MRRKGRKRNPMLAVVGNPPDDGRRNPVAFYGPSITLAPFHPFQKIAVDLFGASWIGKDKKNPPGTVVLNPFTGEARLYQAPPADAVAQAWVDDQHLHRIPNPPPVRGARGVVRAGPWIAWDHNPDDPTDEPGFPPGVVTSSWAYRTLGLIWVTRSRFNPLYDHQPWKVQPPVVRVDRAGFSNFYKASMGALGKVRRGYLGRGRPYAESSYLPEELGYKKPSVPGPGPTDEAVYRAYERWKIIMRKLALERVDAYDFEHPGGIWFDFDLGAALDLIWSVTGSPHGYLEIDPLSGKRYPLDETWEHEVPPAVVHEFGILVDARDRARRDYVPPALPWEKAIQKLIYQLGSLEATAKALGTNPRTLEGYIKKKVPSAVVAKRISELLGEPVSRIHTGEISGWGRYPPEVFDKQIELAKGWWSAWNRGESVESYSRQQRGAEGRAARRYALRPDYHERLEARQEYVPPVPPPSPEEVEAAWAEPLPGEPTPGEILRRTREEWREAREAAIREGRPIPPPPGATPRAPKPRYMRRDPEWTRLLREIVQLFPSKGALAKRLKIKPARLSELLSGKIAPGKRAKKLRAAVEQIHAEALARGWQPAPLIYDVPLPEADWRTQLADLLRFYPGQSALARAAGLRSASVSQWLKGQARPGKRSLLKIDELHQKLVAGELARAPTEPGGRRGLARVVGREDWFEKLQEIRSHFRTQRETAERLGVTPHSMSRYFLGKSVPGRKVLERIDQVLTELRGGQGEYGTPERLMTLLNPDRPRRRNRDSKWKKKPKTKTLTLEQAREHPVWSQSLEAAVRKYRRFHGTDPQKLVVYKIPDSRSSTTQDPDVRVALHETLETPYKVPWSSNKQGHTWYHEHPEGGRPLEVLNPRTGLTTKVGGTYLVDDWWYS